MLPSITMRSPLEGSTAGDSRRAQHVIGGSRLLEQGEQPPVLLRKPDGHAPVPVAVGEARGDVLHVDRVVLEQALGERGRPRSTAGTVASAVANSSRSAIVWRNDCASARRCLRRTSRKNSAIEFMFQMGTPAAQCSISWRSAL